MTEPAIAYISTFPPTQCGIATYSSDLMLHFHSLYPHVKAIKAEINFVNDNYIQQIKELDRDNNLIFHLQHEFKLFGGQQGEEIINLISGLKRPLVTTLHTVKEENNEVRKQIVQEICNKSKLIFLFSEEAKQLLCLRYKVNPVNVIVIPHGVPDISLIYPENSDFRKQVNAGIVFISAGHFRDSKGIDIALRVLSRINKEYSDFKYLLLGSNHPRNTKALAYRMSISEQIESLKLPENVIMVDEYLPLFELVQYIQAADIALVPYTNKEQSSSGILSLFIACGRPVICSNFQFAKSIISKENGILFDIDKEDDFYFAIRKLLHEKITRESMMNANYLKGQDWIWNKVSKTCYEGIYRMF